MKRHERILERYKGVPVDRLSHKDYLILFYDSFSIHERINAKESIKHYRRMESYMPYKEVSAKTTMTTPEERSRLMRLWDNLMG